MDLDSPSVKELSREWREQGRIYVIDVNAFIDRGTRSGWKDLPEEPEDRRTDMAKEVMRVVREANRLGKIGWLRKAFPPAFSAVQELAEERGRMMGMVTMIDRETFLVRRGTAHQETTVFLIRGEEWEPLPGATCVARCPQRRFFAVGDGTGLHVTEGWGGRPVATLRWPDGHEGLPEGYQIHQRAPGEAPMVEQLHLFPGGREAILVSELGIYLLSEWDALRLHPDEQTLLDHLKWSKREYPREPVNFYLNSPHAAISPDGHLMCVGDAGSYHHVLDADFRDVASVGNREEAPCFAIFSADGSQLAVTSATDYNGTTVGVPVEILPGLETDPGELDERFTLLDQDCRVYAAAAVPGGDYILGDAYGYIHSVTADGIPLWRHYLGGTIASMDIDASGKRLVVGTFAGGVHVLDLDASYEDDFTIATGSNKEIRRWLFWDGEKRPLIW